MFAVASQVASPAQEALAQDWPTSARLAAGECRWLALQANSVVAVVEVARAAGPTPPTGASCRRRFLVVDARSQNSPVAHPDEKNAEEFWLQVEPSPPGGWQIEVVPLE